MNFQLWIVWALVGWAETAWSTHGERPSYMERLISLVGGASGGFLWSSVWPVAEQQAGMSVAATCLGAWVGATILTDIVDVVRRMGK